MMITQYYHRVIKDSRPHSLTEIEGYIYLAIHGNDCFYVESLLGHESTLDITGDFTWNASLPVLKNGKPF